MSLFEDAETDILELQASVDRLRSQRQRIERLKLETENKDLIIDQLRRECERATEVVSDLKPVREHNKRLQTQIQVLEDRAKAAEEEVTRRKAEAASALDLQRALERSIAATEERSDERVRELQSRYEEEAHRQRLELRRVQEALADKDNSLRNSEAHVNDLKRRLETEHRDAQRSETELLSRITELESQCNHIKKNVHDYESTIRSLETRVDTLRIEVEKHEQNEHQAQSELLRTKEELAESVASSNYLRRQLSKLEEDSSEREKTLRAELKEERERRTKYETDNHLKNKALETLNSELEEAQKSAKSLGELSRHYEAEWDNARRKAEGLVATNDELSDQVLTLQRQLKEREVESEETKQQVRDLETSLKEERQTRKRWAKARLALISQFNEEGTKLADLLQDSEYQYSSASRLAASYGPAATDRGLGWSGSPSHRAYTSLRKETDGLTTQDLLSELRAAADGSPMRGRRRSSGSTRVSPVLPKDRGSVRDMKVGPLSPPLYASDTSRGGGASLRR